MNTTHRRLRSILFSAVLGASASAQAADYIVTPLQDVPYGFGDFSVGGMNADGTIVGSVFRLDSYTAVTWDATGAATALFPGDSGESNGFSINNNGQVLVYYYGPYLWQNGSVTPISVDPAIRFPAPSLLNDSGLIAGTGMYPRATTGYDYRAYLVRDGVTVDLGTLPGMTNSAAADINNAGDVVGYAYTSLSQPRAVVWRNDAIIDLGTLPGQAESRASAINDHGRIVGSSGGRLVTWDNGVITDLGVIGAGAVMDPASINNHGDIVGTARFASSNTTKAFLWSNGVFTDLSTVVGYTDRCGASAINDAGHIALGCGYPVGGFRLAPTAPATDLTLAMARSAGSLVVGAPFTYTLTIGNGGSLTASNVNVTDALPANMTLVSATTSQGNCTGTAVVSCALNSLAGGATATVQLTVIANAIGAVTNSASVSGSEVENNTFNNTASLSAYVNAASADLAVTLGASATTVTRNANLTYIVYVRNNGPAGATGVKVTDTLPSGMSFVSATTTQGTCSGTTTVTCNLGTLANAANATVKITVKAATRGTFTNTATVTSGVVDSNTGNNNASVTVSVR